MVRMNAFLQVIMIQNVKLLSWCQRRVDTVHVSCTFYWRTLFLGNFIKTIVRSIAYVYLYLMAWRTPVNPIVFQFSNATIEDHVKYQAKECN